MRKRMDTNEAGVCKQRIESENFDLTKKVYETKHKRFTKRYASAFRLCLQIAIALFLFAFLFLISTIDALALQDLMPLQGNAQDSGSPVNNGNLLVTIWTQATDGTLVYNSSTDYNNAINSGRFDVNLGDGTQQLNLDYGKYYYLDMSINGQDLDFNGSERRMFQSTTGDVNWSYISSIPSYVLTSNIVSLVGNWSSDKSSYNTTSQLSSLFYSVSNPLSFINQTQADLRYLLITDQRYNDTVAITNKLDITDQRYNDTVAISTKLDATDQRYNETTLIDNINSSKASIGNCAAGMVVQNVTATGIQCVSQSENSVNIWELYTRKTSQREAMFESVTSGFNEPWVGAAIASGTTATVAGTYNHPGTARLSSSTTASSGYSWQITNAVTYLLGPNYQSVATFQPVLKAGNYTNIKTGFMDVFTVGLPVDAVYFNITQVDASNFVVSGIARNNSVQTKTGSSYTIPGNKWYATKIYINNETLATFSLYNETDLLWTDTVSSNIPTSTGRETSNAFVAYVNGGTTAVILAYMDYMRIGINGTIDR